MVGPMANVTKGQQPDLTDQVAELAIRLNPKAILPEAWRMSSKGESVPLEMAVKVLQAELDRSYFDADHLDLTYSLKDGLSHENCQRITELLAGIFTDRVAREGQSQLLGAFSSDDMNTAGTEIFEKGYKIWPKRLPESLITSIRERLFATSFENRLDGRSMTGAELLAEQEHARGNWWAEDLQQLAAVPELQALAFDPLILAVAQEALGAAPIHVQTNAWWTFPPERVPGQSDEKTEGRNAQRFHQDFEFLNFVKVFVYLTDVTDETGPHVYVAGSANDYEERLPAFTPSHRFADSEIEQAFGDDRIVSITGPKGEVTFVNTRGFHKGMPARRGHRLLVQLEYASSMYFNPVQPAGRAELSSEHAALSSAVPRLFLNYRSEAETAAWKARADAAREKTRRKLQGKSLGQRLRRLWGRK